MQGKYRLFVDGKVVESNNLITYTGQNIILSYLAGEVNTWAGSIAVGVGERLASRSDQRLEFEFGRTPVDMGVSDPNLLRVVFRSTLSETLVGSIYEVGLYSQEYDSNLLNNMMLALFDPTIETIEGGTSVVTNGRIQATSLLLLPGESASMPFNLQLARFDDDDNFTLACHAAATGNVTLRFETDTTNYFTTVLPVTAGYNILEFQKSDAVAIGGPDWDALTQLTVGAVTTSITLDGLRVDQESRDYHGLVSRSVLEEPIVKDFGRELEIEYEVTFEW